MKTGCNAFDSKRPVSKPMSFWLEQDELKIRFVTAANTLLGSKNEIAENFKLMSASGEWSYQSSPVTPVLEAERPCLKNNGKVFLYAIYDV